MMAIVHFDPVHYSASSISHLFFLHVWNDCPSRIFPMRPAVADVAEFWTAKPMLRLLEGLKEARVRPV